MTVEDPKSKPIDIQHSEPITWPPTKNSQEVNHPNVEAAPARSDLDENLQQPFQSGADTADDFTPLIVTSKSDAIRVEDREESFSTSPIQKPDIELRPSIETAQLENEMSELGGLLCNHPGGVRLNHIESNEHPPPPGAQN